MALSRRKFLFQTGAGLVIAPWATSSLAQAAPTAKLRLSACDWSLRASGPEGLETAARLGFEGLEISASTDRKTVGDSLAIADQSWRDAYKASMKKHRVLVSSVAMGLLNNYPYATDDRAQGWLEQTIEGAADLGATNILMAFFGNGDLRDENTKHKIKMIDATVERLKDVAPKAEKAGVILGLENSLDGKTNMDILDRVQHDSVRYYYDIGNLTHYGYDVPSDIRMMGDRICQFHFKDYDDFLGIGENKMEPIAKAIHDINYKGWIVLETKILSGDRDADFKRNAAYTRKLMGMGQ